MKRLVILASLATIGGLGVAGAADATPMQILLRGAPTDEEQRTRITPATERPLLIRAPIAPLMRESVADPMAAGAVGPVSVGAAPSGTWTSPFPSRVSLRLRKTVVSEALKSIQDPRQLRRR